MRDKANSLLAAFLQILLTCFSKLRFESINTPVFKSGEQDDSSNYRPISVLPFLARLFEKLVYNQIYDFMIKNDLLFSNQSAFRLLHSVVTSLLASIND